MLHSSRAQELIERAVAGKLSTGLHCSSLSTQVVELCGLAKLDFVIIGLEVEQVDARSLEELIRTADGAELVTMVKLRRPSPSEAVDAFTAGVHFVMAPHITSGDQLRAMRKAAYFAPDGLRGFCPVARYVGYGAISMKAAIAATHAYNMVIPIVEDREALENIDDILDANEGGIVEIGPFDLSVSLGCERPELSYDNKETMDAIEMVAEKARKRGQPILAPIWYRNDMDPAALRAHQREALLKRGVTLIYDGDLMHLTRYLHGLRSMRDE